MPVRGEREALGHGTGFASNVQKNPAEFFYLWFPKKMSFLLYGLRRHIFLFRIRENAFCLGGAVLGFRWALSLCIAIWPHSTQEKVWISTKLPSLPFPTKLSFKTAKPPPIPTPFLERADTKRKRRTDLWHCLFLEILLKASFSFGKRVVGWTGTCWHPSSFLLLLFLGEAATPFHGSVKSPSSSGGVPWPWAPSFRDPRPFFSRHIRREQEAKIGHGTSGN